MTWTARLRLLGGMLLVLALLTALTLLFNQRRSEALSVTGQVVTDRATVGAVYGGVVLHEFATEGSVVRSGEALYAVASPDLRRDLAQGLEPTSTSAYDIDAASATVTYKALSDGRLTDVSAVEGGYVQSGAELASIVAVGSERAVADFVLSPRDYERIQGGARVDLLLPDDRSVPGTVEAVSVRTDHGRAMTTVTVGSAALRDPGLSALTQPGTPVSATLTLRDDGPLAGPTDTFFGFLRQIGLQ